MKTGHDQMSGHEEKESTQRTRRRAENAEKRGSFSAVLSALCFILSCVTAGKIE